MSVGSRGVCVGPQVQPCAYGDLAVTPTSRLVLWACVGCIYGPTATCTHPRSMTSTLHPAAPSGHLANKVPGQHEIWQPPSTHAVDLLSPLTGGVRTGVSCRSRLRSTGPSGWRRTGRDGSAATNPTLAWLTRWAAHSTPSTLHPGGTGTLLGKPAKSPGCAGITQ